MDHPVLEVRDLSVSVGERPVLKGVSLAVLPGEVHVLLGPNGGGKTTLLMAVMGMPGYRVTGGRILFRGADVTALPADERARAGIALSFQRPPAVRGVTVRTLVGEIIGRRGGRARRCRSSRTRSAPTPCSTATSTSGSPAARSSAPSCSSCLRSTRRSRSSTSRSPASTSTASRWWAPGCAACSSATAAARQRPR